MARRQREWASKAATALKSQLGGVCAHCGEDDLSQLEFDHIHGRDYRLEQIECSARISRYRREAMAGKLQLLCGDCNKRKDKPPTDEVKIPA